MLDDGHASQSPLPPLPEKAFARWLREHARALRWTFRLVGAVLAYGICWVLAYALVNGDLNGELLVQYFVLAWTGNAFVRPAFTWWLSMIGFSAVLFVWWALARRARRRNDSGDAPH